jgi:hypothetical protein
MNLNPDLQHFTDIDIFEVGEFGRKRCTTTTRKRVVEANWLILSYYICFEMIRWQHRSFTHLLLDFQLLPCSWWKVRRSSADAVSCRVGPWAGAKKRPFHFSTKNIRNVVISMLQGQKMELVGTQFFNADFHLFDSKHDGTMHYESEMFKENLSSILKIFAIERSYGKS